MDKSPQQLLVELDEWKAAVWRLAQFANVARTWQRDRGAHPREIATWIEEAFVSSLRSNEVLRRDGACTGCGARSHSFHTPSICFETGKVAGVQMARAMAIAPDRMAKLETLREAAAELIFAAMVASTGVVRRDDPALKTLADALIALGHLERCTDCDGTGATAGGHWKCNTCKSTGWIVVEDA